MRFSTPISNWICRCALTGVALTLMANPAFSQIRVTEIMSSSGGATGVGTEDWFELTNYGSSSVDLTGWKVDDGSYTFANSLAINGVTSLAAGESALFLEAKGTLGDEATEVATLRSFWGGSAQTAQVGWYRGSGIGLSSNGDGLVLFNAGGSEATPRIAFGAATGGSSFYWAYRADGSFAYGGPSNGVVSTIGTLPGENGGISQTTFGSVDPAPSPFNVTNIGSPGSAAVVPEPSTVALAAAGIALAGLAARRRLRKA